MKTNKQNYKQLNLEFEQTINVVLHEDTIKFCIDNNITTPIKFGDVLSKFITLSVIPQDNRSEMQQRDFMVLKSALNNIATINLFSTNAYYYKTNIIEKKQKGNKDEKSST